MHLGLHVYFYLDKNLSYDAPLQKFPHQLMPLFSPCLLGFEQWLNLPTPYQNSVCPAVVGSEHCHCVLWAPVGSLSCLCLGVSLLGKGLSCLKGGNWIRCSSSFYQLCQLHKSRGSYLLVTFLYFLALRKKFAYEFYEFFYSLHLFQPVPEPYLLIFFTSHSPDKEARKAKV